MSWSTFPPRFGMAANRWGLKSSSPTVSDRTWVQAWDGVNTVITVVPGDFGGITAVQLFDSPSPDTLSHYGDLRNTGSAIQFTSNVFGALAPLPFTWSFGSEKMRLTGTGLAIGTAGTDPQVMFQIGTGGQIQFDRPDAVNEFRIGYTSNDLKLRWTFNAGGALMTLNNTGGLELVQGVVTGDVSTLSSPGAAAYENQLIISNPKTGNSIFATQYWYAGGLLTAGIEGFKVDATNGNLQFKTTIAGTYAERMRVDESGVLKLQSHLYAIGIGRFEGGGGVGAGAGTELGSSGGGGYVQAFNRTTSAYIPLTFFASAYSTSGAGGFGINCTAGTQLDVNGVSRTTTNRVDAAPSGGNYGLDQGNGLQTIANGGTYDIPNFSGMIIMSDPSVTGQTGVFICGAGTTTLVAQTGTIYATVAAAGKVSLTYVGLTGYRITNNQGASISFGIATIRTRVTA